MDDPHRRLSKRARRRRFRFADSTQQVVGGALLAGAFVVTEKVWLLTRGIDPFKSVLAVLVVALVGYGVLYRADTGRDPELERDVAGVPVRFLSLLTVAFGSTLALAVLFDVPDTFLGGVRWATIAKAVSMSAVFNVVGDATANSLF
jgi:uncharacterized membrane protein